MRLIPELQDTTFATVLSVLNSTRSADIPKVLSSLDAASQDNLMKYIYKGMSNIDENSHCSVLLNWHEKVCTSSRHPCRFALHCI